MWAGAFTDYPRALRYWRRAFVSNFDSQIVPALQDSHPKLGPAEVAAFYRKWICESPPAYD
jgi:hypothetical protein